MKIMNQTGVARVKITLKNIADRANVSIVSVSRALSKDQTGAPIHDQTRMRIIEIAKEMGYHKLQDHRWSPDTVQEKKIGLVMHLVKEKYHDPYFSEMMYGIESELTEHGCKLDVSFEVQEVLQSAQFAELDKEQLALLCIGPLKPAFLKELSRQVPFIMSVGGLLLPEIDCVSVDFRSAARHAVEHLLRLGHRDIAFIGGDSRVGASMEQEERFIGFKETMEAHHVPMVREWIHEGGFSLSKSYEAMMRILQLEKRPTAVFTASDIMALGAYKAIQEAGLSIPEDLSVISFDDNEMARFVNPAITTVRVYKETMGRVAVKLLLERMEGRIPLPLNTLLPTELIVRGSCAGVEELE